MLVLHSSEGEDLRPGVRPKDQGPYTRLKRTAEVESRSPAGNGKRFNRLLFFCRLDEAGVNDLLYHYAQARKQGELQDKEFHDNPNKEAAVPKMRQGRDHHNGKKSLV